MAKHYYSKKIALISMLEQWGLLPELYPKKYREIWQIITKLKINRQNAHLRYTLYIKAKAILSFNNLPLTWQLKNNS